MTTDLLAGLNPPQQQAVSILDGPMMVLAGAGSGKTRVLTRRLANLVAQGVPPWRIVAVTFTNKAAAEMRGRVVELIGPNRDMWVGTFHSISSRLLRSYAETIGLSRNFVIYDADDQKALVRKLLKEWNLTHDAKSVRSTIQLMEAYRGRRVDKLFGPHAGMFDDYMKRLAACNAVDFTGLIERVLELQDILPKLWDYVLVDEFQDTSKLQFAMLRAMVADKKNICVVGDDDQSIYSWRGANPEYLLRFEKEFPGTRIIRLEQNYRSSGNIISAAAALISNNLSRHGKTLWTNSDPGVPIVCRILERERDEAREVVETMQEKRPQVPLEQMAILYRVNAQSRPFEEELRRAQLPYRIVGGMRFYERAEIKDVLSYLRLAVNPSSDLDFLRAVRVPVRGVGPGTLEKLSVAAKETGQSLWDHCTTAHLSITPAARKGLDAFLQLVGELQEQAQQVPPHELLQHLLEKTDVMGLLHSAEDEDLGRKENIDELYNSMEEYAGENPDGRLGDWLDSVSLLTTDEIVEGEEQGVTLMTIHSAKGLEYDIVFLPGWEEGLFPLRRAEEEVNLEEERRLAYVAITRARREVHISRVRTRMMYGNVMRTTPSQFLHELPRTCLDIRSSVPAQERFSLSAETPAPARERPAEPALSFAARPAKAPPRSTDSRAKSPPADGFAAGRRVRHPKFGDGTVTAVVGEGDMRKAMVKFAPAEPPKVILVSFLQLL